MKRLKKIRGGKRRLKAIKLWVANYKYLELDYLRTYEKDHVKFRVAPWGRFIINNIEFAQPKKALKKELINGLIEIYNSWQKQLNTLNTPYYLKIWLFEKEIKKSQVVCAIQSKINFYDNTFEKPNDDIHTNKSFPFLKTHPLTADFNWDIALDNLYIENDFIQNPNEFHNEKDYLEAKKWFNKVVLKQHKRIDTFGNNRSFYVLDNDIVWLGQKNN